MGKRKIALAVVLLIMALLIFSFFYYEAVKNLKFRIVGANLRDISLTGARIELEVEVSNPSIIPVYLTGTSFTILIDNQSLGQGTTEATIINSRDSTIMTANIEFSYVDVALTMRDMIREGGSVTVTIKGQAHLFIVDVPFTNTTTIKIGGT
jgi:LEA14-like dessication related protein